MVQDIRKIIFSSDELLAAFESYGRTTQDFLPAGKILSCTPSHENGHKIVIKMDSQDDALTYSGTEALHPLILFCLENNIMLPRDGRKTFAVIGENAVLTIDLNLEVDLAFVEAPLTSEQIETIKDDG